MQEAEIKQNIIDFLETENSSKIRQIHNNYCEANHSNDYIYFAEDLEDLLQNVPPVDALLRGKMGNFDVNAPYVRIDGYGNIQSMYDTDVLDMVDIEGIADYCIANNDSLDDFSIEKFLTELD